MFKPKNKIETAEELVEPEESEEVEETEEEYETDEDEESEYEEPEVKKKPGRPPKKENANANSNDVVAEKVRAMEILQLAKFHLNRSLELLDGLV